MSTTTESRFSFGARHGQWKAYAAGVAVLLCAVVAAWASQSAGRARNVATFRTRASTLAASLRSELSDPVEAVRTIPPYFAASGLVESTEFTTFVEPMFDLFPSLVRVGFAPRITGPERDAVEATAAANGFPQFAVRERYEDGTLGPSRPKAAYLPLLFCEPRCGTDVGLDLAALGRTAVAALDSRRVTLGNASTITTDRSVPGRLTVFAPFAGRPVTGPDARVPRTGVALVEVDVPRAIRGVVERIPQGTMPLEIVDERASGPRALLFSTTGEPLNEPARDGVTFVERVRLHDHVVAIRFVAPPSVIAVSAMPLVILGAGVLLAIATTLTILFAMNARRLRAAVKAARDLGPYHLIRKIGEGGMGTVYEAEHRLLRRPTAVKMITDVDSSRDALERFEREAKITSRLTHPNTVSVFDFGRTNSGSFYYAMEYVRGMTLDDLGRQEGPQPPARVAHILSQIAGSLGEAHTIGFVHRDVKPANVMICSRGGLHDFVKVLDFGLVKDTLGREDTGLSLVGQTLGTPRYMAPEVFVDGAPPTPASDVYAVGAIGWFLLTGRELIQGSTYGAILSHHAAGVVLRPSELRPASDPVPPDLEALLLRCLDGDPEKRPLDANALGLELERCVLPTWTARQTIDETAPSHARSQDDFGNDATIAIDDASRVRSNLSTKDDGRAA